MSAAHLCLNAAIIRNGARCLGAFIVSIITAPAGILYAPQSISKLCPSTLFLFFIMSGGWDGDLTSRHRATSYRQHRREPFYGDEYRDPIITPIPGYSDQPHPFAPQYPPQASSGMAANLAPPTTVGYWKCIDCNGAYHRNDERCPGAVQASSDTDQTYSENRSHTSGDDRTEKDDAPVPPAPTIVQNFYNGHVVKVSDSGTQMGGDDPVPGYANLQTQTDGDARATLPPRKNNNRVRKPSAKLNREA